MSKIVYLDNAATTPLTPRVKEVLFTQLDLNYGNPSSMHAIGRRAKMAIEEARKIIARHLKASIGEIFFTSGGTESNNTVLTRSVTDLNVRRIITSPVEHPCVLETIAHLQKAYAIETDFLRTDEEGRVDIHHLEELLATNNVKTLVSVMHANNEVGSLNDIQKIGALSHQYKALFHSDTVQTIGYYPHDLSTQNIDFLCGSAHKFHGPKGVGLLYINDKIRIRPMLFGGHQERNMRSGTENTAYIVAMATALDEAYQELEANKNHIEKLRQYAVMQVKKCCPHIKILNPNGFQSHYKILNLALPLTDRSTLALMNMDLAGICVSAGSACSSGAEKGSHVFDHLFPHQDLKLLRLSFSVFNTTEDVDKAVAALQHILSE